MERGPRDRGECPNCWYYWIHEHWWGPEPVEPDWKDRNDWAQRNGEGHWIIHNEEACYFFAQ